MTEASNARPIHSQGLLLFAVAAGVLLLAIYLTSSIIENENGGISAAVRTIGIGLAVWAFVRPKTGLYILSIEAFSLDYIKKIAVYYGTVSMGTVIEVLVVGMLAVIGTLSGFLIQSVAFRRYKLPPLLWVVLTLATLASLAVLVAGERTVGFEKSAENAFNSCVYIAIALPMSILLTDRAQLMKLINVQFFLATLWAALGIKQYYTGFSQMEWFYAETGLSTVASSHMLTTASPRPFGFGTGVSNYSVVGAYLSYGFWQVTHQSRRRFIFILCTLVLFWGVITSLQRTTILLPILALVLYYFMQNMRRSALAYFGGFAIFIAGVWYAETLYVSLDKINEVISLRGDWSESVLNVNTYSDRIASWMNLKNPANYSLFGLNQNIGSHDVFTKILVSYGVVGLLLTLIVMTSGSWFVLRTIHRVEDPQDRRFATYCLSITAMTLAVGFIGGGNFTANPVNLALWSFFGIAISMVVNSRLATDPVKPSLKSIVEALQASRPKVPMAARSALLSSER